MDFLTQNAIKYTLGHLFSVAIPNHSLIKDISISESEVVVVLEDDQSIRFLIMTPTQREGLLKHELPLIEIKSFDKKVNVPIYSIKSANTFFEIKNERELVVNMDIISLSFIMLSRYEEIIIKERDIHERFEYKNSLAFHYNFIDIPIVDEYAFLLRDAIVKFLSNISITPKKGKVIPTHDIDDMRRFGGVLKNLRTIIGGDLLIRKNIDIAYKSIKQLFRTKKDIYNDPYIQAILKLIEISKKHDLRSEFYFIGLIDNESNATYNIFMSEVKYCMSKIKDANMLIGIHGGFGTSTDLKQFKIEKQRLEEVAEQTITMGRQHFLMFDINRTIDIWEKSGITRDTTLGYAEREGYRCGTCHEYNLYHIQDDRITTIKESPLIVMEGTLFDYRKLDNKSALKKVETLYNRCMTVEGNFVILWHNANMDREYEKHFNEVYTRFFNDIYSEA